MTRQLKRIKYIFIECEAVTVITTILRWDSIEVKYQKVFNRGIIISQTIDFVSSEAQCAEHRLIMMRLQVRSAHELSAVALLERATSQKFSLLVCEFVIEMRCATANYKLLTVLKHV